MTHSKEYYKNMSESAEVELEHVKRVSYSRLMERNAAHRWSAAWKRAAKFWYASYWEGEYIINIANTKIDEARSIARRLLRERNEATLLLTDCQERVDRYFAKITSLKSQVQFSEKQNQNLVTHHRIERDRAAFENEALQSQVNHLESDRDALAKQVDALAKQVDELRAVIEIPKWGGWNSLPHCPWCLRTGNHAYNCPRQKALGKV